MGDMDEFVIEAEDGTQITCYRWVPQAAPTAIVQLVHGMGEHARRYDHLAGALTNAGYVVYGHDQRGYGKTALSGQDLGTIGRAGWHGYIDDIGLVNAKSRHDFADVPVLLIGHSMGSFEVQEYLVDHSDSVDAAVLSGTAAVNLLFAEVNFNEPLDLGAFNAPFAPARTESDWLSRDEEQVDKYIADPLCGSALDPEASEAMYAGGVKVAEPASLARVRKDLPILITVGDADPVNAGMVLVTVLAERLVRAGIEDVTVASYAGARHEVFNETNRDEVIGDLLAWLAKHTHPSTES